MYSIYRLDRLVVRTLAVAAVTQVRILVRALFYFLVCSRHH